VKLQVKDNGGTLANDTAKVTIKAFPYVGASTSAIDLVEATFGLQFTTPFYANDTNNDGTLDTFSDPNDLLNEVRFVTSNGNSSFLLSTNSDQIPEFFWDTKANKTVLISYVPVLSTETWIDSETQEVLVIVEVEKSGWVYLQIADVYPPESYPDFTLVVNTTNGRVVSPDMIWRENGQIYILDDPSAQYILTYGYTMLPPVFSPSNGVTFNNAKPTIAITFFEETILTTATFGNMSILDVLTSTDQKTFIFVPTSDLADGTYTFSVVGQDTEGNSIAASSTYTINAPIVEASSGLPWFVIILVVIVLFVVIFLVILRIRLVI
jgi:hypothetical protein